VDDDLTAAQRIRWAKDHSQKTWQQLGAETGCTHAALVMWATGKSDVLNGKVSLVVAYARAAGVNLHWLLTGEGERLTPPQRAEHRLVQEARRIASERPAMAEGACRVLLAFESALHAGS